MAMNSAKTTYWQRTPVANLLKNAKSGRYYARFVVSGKQIWRNLDTDVFTVAKLRLADEKAAFERNRSALAAVSAGSSTMADLITIYRTRLAARADISESTRTRYREHLQAITKTWPGFAEMSPLDVTRVAIEHWRSSMQQHGTGYRPPGAKNPSKNTAGNSAGSINKALDALSRLLDIAVERGQVHCNAARARGLKLRNTPRKPRLPDSAILTKLFAEIEANSGGRGVESADLCRGFAFTGSRLREAAALRWADVDFERGMLFVRGTKTEAAAREIPLIPAARALLNKILKRRQECAATLVNGTPHVDPKERVFGVREAQGSLTRACDKLGIERLTHHDLRDAFATAALEAGVDVRTIAEWLGHKDGGALLLKTYAHHRRSHSLSQASKVTFGSVG